MADVTNAFVIARVGDVVRPTASAIVEFYLRCKNASAEWTTSGAAALCGNSGEDSIRDASNPVSGTPDGKQQLTAYDADAHMNDIAAFVVWFEAESRLARAAKVANHLSTFDVANM